MIAKGVNSPVSFIWSCFLFTITAWIPKVGERVERIKNHKTIWNLLPQALFLWMRYNYDNLRYPMEKTFMCLFVSGISGHYFQLYWCSYLSQAVDGCSLFLWLSPFDVISSSHPLEYLLREMIHSYTPLSLVWVGGPFLGLPLDSVVASIIALTTWNEIRLWLWDQSLDKSLLIVHSMTSSV